ncbi:MAG: flagellar basal body-associated FliL family protein [Burkholderiaceae bacterium]
MSAAATADTAPGKPKSKKLLFIILGVVLVALIGAGAALFLVMKNAAAVDEGGDEESSAQAEDHPKTPPAFLQLENMVVNLADPGGNRFVQVGITLQLDDAEASKDLEAFMPSVRSAILMLISQRTSDEVLQIEGKGRLSRDIIRAIGDIMGYDPAPEPGDGKRKRKSAKPNPVHAVLFSSFIVQ